MSVLSAMPHNGPGKAVMAEMPVILQSSDRHLKQKSPQQKLDDFWKKFTTEAPGKATTVIPQNKYAGKAAKAKSSSSSSGTTTQASYEEAAALCKAKVEKIANECRRINQKYRDPHFDLEFDLKMNRRDCLESLSNIKPEDIDDDSSSSSSHHRKKARASANHQAAYGDRARQEWHEGEGEKEEMGAGSKKQKQKEHKRDGRFPQDHDPNSAFRPKSVKRVGEIFDDPKFYIEGPTASDVRQGRDGDCWLMAALCTLSNKPGLIEKICVAKDEAVGVYGFVFHRDGEWFSEIIDDKLYLTKPDYDEVNLERLLWEDRDRINSEESYRKTYQSNSGALYFAQCENPNETWLPLLEKAYAKAHGDYAAIEGGFTGEGIEDLTGGVTSELFTTDILDKEYFWKEELMKVNEQFLFGCSTGVWGRGWGERKGIMELHAYSVMRAVELDGERLVLLKNPWGKGEWKGAWSDGSKEWTPEWLKKLNHRFGDDGNFWISYDDLLRKYQAFDRTRLFGNDWKVTSIWTTLSVPWNLEYHDTKFAFTLAKSGPVVLVLSQLDDRYFRGLEGPYRFELSFRLHVAGEDDYVVRSQRTYRMNRSVNVELDLPAGEYHVLMKIDATRDDSVMPAEDVVRANANDRREKLIRIGLAYDLAHSKGKIIESPEEKKAREAYETWKKEKERKQMRERIVKARQRTYYFQVKDMSKRRKRMEKQKAKRKAKEEARQAEAEKRMAERGPTQQPPPGHQRRHNQDEGGRRKNAETETKLTEQQEADGRTGNLKARNTSPSAEQQQSADTSEFGDTKKTAQATKTPTQEAADEDQHEVTTPSQSQDKDTREDAAKDGDSNTELGENTPSITSSQKSTAEKTPSKPDSGGRDLAQAVPELGTAGPGIMSAGTPTGAAAPLLDAPSKDPKDTGSSQGIRRVPDSQPSLLGETESAKPPEKPETSGSEATNVGEATGAKGELSDGLQGTSSQRLARATAEEGELDRTDSEWGDGGKLPKEETFHSARTSHDCPREREGIPISPAASTAPPSDVDCGGYQEDDGPPRQRGRSVPNRSRAPPGGLPRHRPGGPPHHLHPPMHHHKRRGPGGMRPLPPPPPPASYFDDEESSWSISSLSEMSDRELDYYIEDNKRNPRPLRGSGPPPMPGRTPFESEDEDYREFEKNPWNAVAMVGFRVYYKVAKEEQEEEGEGGEDDDKKKIKENIVKLRVVRPVLSLEVGDGDGEQQEKKTDETKDEAKVLDLDDSAKDATLEEPDKKVIVEDTRVEEQMEQLQGEKKTVEDAVSKIDETEADDGKKNADTDTDKHGALEQDQDEQRSK